MQRKQITAALALLSLAAVAFAADAPKNLLKATNKPDTWRFEQHEQAKGAMTADGDAIVFNVTETDGTDWHVQAVQPGLDLKEGKDYVLSFKAKAEGDRTVPVVAMIDQEDWHGIGLAESAEIGKDWKDYKYEFHSEGTVASKNRVGFILGNDKGKVWVKDMVLAEKQ